MSFGVSAATWAMIGAGTAAVGTIASSNAAGKAADAQVHASDAANDESRREYDLSRADQAPWMDAGRSALSDISSGIGPNGDLMRRFSLADYAADPGYQFRLSEGEKGINRAAAARGGYNSGATLKALARFNQDTASGEYANAYNRYTNDQGTRFNRLASIAGLGQNATNQVGQAGTAMADRVGQNLIGAGNARASGYVGATNAITNGVSQYMNYNQNQQLLNTLSRPPNIGSSASYAANDYLTS